mmetsp:Transcript_7345/g.15957  ORF Transcript_7345/g.15957 Transcript_7345/m.15957 type:complete len:282 (+) Transcript_7345:108-953(+)
MMTKPRRHLPITSLLAAIAAINDTQAFISPSRTLVPPSYNHRSTLKQQEQPQLPDSSSENNNINNENPQKEKNYDKVIEVQAEILTPEEEAKVGNLVANEEWAGLSMELAEIVRTAVIEDLKKNSREFLNKDDYAIGDFSKEIDRRVKDEVAKMREKDEYELGDFSVVLDDRIKEMVCEMTGKEEYEFGDLSVEIDKRVKSEVAKFCGKDDYEFGDLSVELAKRTKAGVLKYTGKDDYQFGDVTKQAIKNFTGKEEYQFGDVTKKLMGNLFSGKKGKNDKK